MQLRKSPLSLGRKSKQRIVGVWVSMNRKILCLFKRTPCSYLYSMEDTVDVGTHFLISQMKLISAYFSGGDFLKAVDDLLGFCTLHSH